MPKGELNRQVQISDAALDNVPAQEQRRKMLVALALLLMALSLVLVKERQFWFPSLWTGGSEEVERSPSDTRAHSRRHATAAASRRARSKQHAGATVPPASDALATVSPGIAQRAVSLPLRVEVISGSGQHRTIRTRNAAINIDLQDKSSATPANPTAGAGPEDRHDQRR